VSHLQRIIPRAVCAFFGEKGHGPAGRLPTQKPHLVDRAAGILEPIPETPAIIRGAVTAVLIPDPTDNLIHHSILDPAGRSPAATKAFLTDNLSDFATEDVQAALASVGINQPFRSVTNVLGWLGLLPH
jgi:hypothetical protein